MKYEFILAKDSSGALWLKSDGRARRVVTVAETCRRLRRTRRQVYRHIRSGTLETRGKVLGDWVLDAESVTRLAGRPLTVQPLPSRLQARFPEHDVSRLNAGRDGVLIVSRLLESGELRDVRWLLRRYGRDAIRRFLREDGSRLLSARALRLWSLFFHARPSPLPSWRQSANPWPGANP